MDEENDLVPTAWFGFVLVWIGLFGVTHLVGRWFYIHPEDPLGFNDYTFMWLCAQLILLAFTGFFSNIVKNRFCKASL